LLLTVTDTARTATVSQASLSVTAAAAAGRQQRVEWAQDGMAALSCVWGVTAVPLALSWFLPRLVKKGEMRFS
jgi:hypothetical protein